jgi:hypothetical protein
MEREFLICECESLEHLACFTFFDDNVVVDNEGTEMNFKYVTLSVHLKKLPFFKRLVNGVKYIFGHTSVYGDYDEFIIGKEYASKFRKVAKYLEKAD